MASLPRFIEAWRSITNDPQILQIVTRGVSIEFNTIPTQDKPACTHVSQDEAPHIDREVQKLLELGVIEKCRKTKGEYVSTVFTRVKKDGVSRRMIINLKPIKQYIKYRKFKMDTFRSCLNLVHQNDYCASIDLSDAYYTVPLHKKYKKYVRFIWKGIRYQYRVLAMGLSSAPRQFTKLLKPVMAHLQRQQIAISAYLDDLFITGSTREKCMQDVQRTIQVLRQLGFAVNESKSVVRPTQVISHLGFEINTLDMTVKLGHDKLARLQARAIPLLKPKHTIRQVMSFIGTAEACVIAVEHGHLHKHFLERSKNRAMEAAGGNLNTKMTISSKAREEVIWWTQYDNEDPSSIIKAPVAAVLHADASDEGWGAVSGNLHANGRWFSHEQELHINAKELLAIEFGLKALFQKRSNIHIQIFSDNTTAVAFVRRMGGCKSLPCLRIALRIWNWAIERRIWLSIAHVPGLENTRADSQSREFNDKTEWKLQEAVFQDICAVFGVYPTIDLFASRLNYQLPRFVSWNPEPDAIATDAFSLIWSQEIYYIFPPFSLIGRVVNKVVADRTRAVMIVPEWPTQHWWAILQELMEAPPLKLPSSRTLLYLPFDRRAIHPLSHKLKLQACLVFGGNYRTKASRQMRPSIL